VSGALSARRNISIIIDAMTNLDIYLNMYVYLILISFKGSEIDEDDIMVSESEDSNESWTTEEFSSEFIMRYGSRSSAPNGSNEKPFACPVPGCKKRYKNVNGIKYHSKNGHKKDGK
jgi:hypothetical protein